jgi:hypothetical protein
MRMPSSFLAIGALLLSLTLQAAAPAPNSLTPAEKAAGWKLLFNGKNLKGWRNFKKEKAPEKGWVVENGWLKHVQGGGGEDIITTEEFTDFDLEWDWMIPEGANNGIKYFIVETRNEAIGHEYQMIDEKLVKDPKDSTGSFYDVLPPSKDKPLHPPGQVNHSRVLVQGKHVEHWLNGQKIVEYELGSPEVLAAVARSKFRSVPGFATKALGHILLTDHKDEASFQNIKIRVPKSN